MYLKAAPFIYYGTLRFPNPNPNPNPKPNPYP